MRKIKVIQDAVLKKQWGTESEEVRPALIISRPKKNGGEEITIMDFVETTEERELQEQLREKLTLAYKSVMLIYDNLLIELKKRNSFHILIIVNEKCRSTFLYQKEIEILKKIKEVDATRLGDQIARATEEEEEEGFTVELAEDGSIVRK